MKHFVALAFLAIGISVANAAPPDDLLQFIRCNDQSDSLKRLACYDGATKKILGKKGGAALTASIAEAQRIEMLKVEEEKAANERARIERDAASAAAVERAKVVSDSKDVLAAIRKFQIKIQTGMSYQDYTTALSDLKFSVSQFTEGSTAQKIFGSRVYLGLLIEDYDTAQAVWRRRIDKHRHGWAWYDFIEPDDDLFSSLQRSYPAVSNTRVIDRGLDKGFLIDGVVEVIWAAAEQRVLELKSRLGSP